MPDSDDIIPRPPLVRERLARSLRQARLFRRLLRLSVEAAEERHREPCDPQLEARPEAVAT
jgi:hypothetical protein